MSVTSRVQRRTSVCSGHLRWAQRQYVLFVERFFSERNPSRIRTFFSDLLFFVYWLYTDFLSDSQGSLVEVLRYPMDTPPPVQQLKWMRGETVLVQLQPFQSV